MSYIGIIPARHASSRFPGKVLCDLHGEPMIKRVYDSVMKWNKWDKVIVATESREVCDACKVFSIPFQMTRDTHLDCLDRAAEVVHILEQRGEGSNKYIVIQGDEPLFNVETLDVDLSPPIINFYTEVKEKDELYGDAAANAVKVVVSDGDRALYFSRFTLPYHDEKTKRTTQRPHFYKQIGVYLFTGPMLKLYTSLKPSRLECMEGIGLNRLLENDIDIAMRYTPHDSVSIDTEEDRQRILKIMSDISIKSNPANRESISGIS